MEARLYIKINVLNGRKCNALSGNNKRNSTSIQIN